MLEKGTRLRKLLIDSSIFILIVLGLFSVIAILFSSQLFTGNYVLNVNLVVSSMSVLQVDGVSSPIPLNLTKVGEEWFYNITDLSLDLPNGNHIIRIIDGSNIIYEQNVTIGSGSPAPTNLTNSTTSNNYPSNNSTNNTSNLTTNNPNNFSSPTNLSSTNSTSNITNSTIDDFGFGISDMGFGIQASTDFPRLNLTFPSVASGTIVTNSTLVFNASIDSINAINSTIFNWNSSNYTIYNSSLVLMMNFDNLSSLGENGTFVADLSQYSNNGVLVNGTVVNSTWGKNGAGATFNGMNQSINVLDSASLKTDNMTVTAWINVRNFSNTNIFYFLSKQGWNIEVMGTSPNDCSAGTRPGSISVWNGTSTTSTLCSNTNITANVWYFVTLTINTTRASLYLNGFLENYSSSTFKLSSTSTSNLTIGARYDKVWFFNGSIDDVRIWNRYMPPDEVYQQYLFSLSKYNSTEWYFFANESSTGIPYGTYNYSVCSMDSFGNNNCTETRSWVISNVSSIKTSFTNPTTTNASFASNNSLFVNVSIDSINSINSTVFNWNGTNFVLYNDSLVLMMPFENVSSLNENSTYVADISTYGNNGITVNSVFVNATNGYYGGGAAFRGINEYIKILDSPSLRSSAVSASLWLKGNTNFADKSNFYPLSKRGWNIGISGSDSNPCGGVRSGAVFIWNGTSPNGNACSGTNLSVGVWYNVAFSMNQTKTVLYINGVAENFSATWYNLSAQSTGVNLTIGARFDNILFFNGSIDDVKVWNRALTPGEVYQQYVSSMYRYNSTEWYSFSNQSNSLVDFNNYTTSFCSTDTFGSSNCTETRTFFLINNSMLLVNYTSPTQANGTNLAGNSFTVNSTIDSQYGLNNLYTSLNGINYNLYNSSLILMYNFDNISSFGEGGFSNFTKDLSLYGNDGFCANNTRIAGCNYTLGAYGYALSFNGNTSTLTVPNSNSLASSRTAVTVSAWVNPRNQQANQVVMKGTLGTSGYLLQTWSDSKINWNIGNGVQQQITSGNVLADLNTWQMITGTYNGTNMVLYKNGLLVGINNLTSSITQNTQPLFIGMMANGFNGSIDEVRIWNRSLSPQEVYQVYTSSLNKFNATEWYFYSNQTSLASGINTFYVCTNDSVGSSNCTSSLSYTLGSLSPYPSFIAPTQSNATQTVNSTYQVNVSVVEPNITSINWNWNGTNFAIFNSSLVLMMNFDNNTFFGENNSNKTYDSSLYSNNGTCFNMGPGCNYTTGRFGYGIQFDGINDFINTTLPAGTGGPLSQITASAWVFAKNYTGNMFILEKAPVNTQWEMFFESTVLKWRAGTTIDNVCAGPAPNVWHYILGTQNSTNSTLYIDGVICNSSIVMALGNGTRNFYIGAHDAVGYFFNGTIDEVRIWNRSMNSTEVYESYLYNLNKFNSTQWYFFVNQTNSSNKIGLGNYPYYLCANNSYSASNCTDARTLVVDNVINAVSIVYPLNAQYYSSQINALNYSLQYDPNLQACWYSTNLGITNVTINCGQNITGLNSSEGGNTWIVYANNSFGTYSYYSSNFFQDTQIPYPSFINTTPADGTVYTSQIGSIQINTSIISSGLSNANFIWNGTNFTFYNQSLLLMLNFDNISLLGERTQNNLSYDSSLFSNNGTCFNMGIGCNYTAGRYGTGIKFNGVNQFINGTSPIGTGGSTSIFVSAWVFSDNFTRNMFVVEKAPLNNMWQLFFESSPGGQLKWRTNSTNSIDSTCRPPANNQWHFIAASQNSTNATVYIDGVICNSSILPALGNGSGTYYVGGFENGGYPFNGTIDEVRIWNRSMNSTEVYESYLYNLNKFNSTQWYFFVNQSNVSGGNIDFGTYTYTICLNDSAQNTNCTETRSFSVDANPPQLNFTYPTPNTASSSNNNNITVNVSIINSALRQVNWNFNNQNFNLYNNSLILMMNFENNSAIGENGSFVADSSQYSNNGVIRFGSILSAPGFYGNAFNFSGPFAGLINVTDNANLRLNRFTISAWIKSDYPVNTTARAVISKGGTIADDNYLFLWSHPTASFQQAWSLRSGATWFNAKYVTSLQQGVWYHILGTYNGSTLVAYLNGNPETRLVATTPNVGTFPLTIGNTNGGTQAFMGIIDEIRIWNRSLTDQEAYEVYATNLFKYNSTLWYFNANQSANATSKLGGNYTYSLCSTNSLGAQNCTETRSAVASALASSGSISYPANIWYPYVVKNITISLPDPLAQSCQYSTNLGVTNFSFVCGQNITGLTGQEGNNTWYVFINNSYGINTTLSVSFTQDSIDPLVDYLSPTPDTAAYTLNVSLNANLSIVENNLDQFTWGFNGTNYTLFNDSLVLMMNLDNASGIGENGTNFVDVGNYSYNGSCKGASCPSLTTGKSGNAYSFDGVSNNINISSSPNLDLSTATFIAWVNASWPDSFTSANPVVLSKRNSASTRYSIHFGGGTGCASANVSCFGIWNGASYVTAYTGNAMSKNVWHQIALTVTGTTMNAYVDGMLRGTATQSLGSATGLPFNIGGAPWGTTEFFKGGIDQVKVWNRVLTANEIYEEYASTLYKYNSTQWYFYVNQSLNTSAALPFASYQYYACANDTAGNNNCSTTRVINIGIPPPIINFVSPTPANGTFSGTNYLVSNISVIDGNLTSFSWVWNGTEFNLFNSSLVLMMNFENYSSLGENGTFVADASNYSNNGTVILASSGPVLNPNGRFGNAYNFTGEFNGEINVSDTNSLRTNRFTVSAWIKSDYPVNSTNRTVIAKGSSIPDENYLFAWGHINPAFRQAWTIRSGSTWYNAKYVTSLQQGVWYHILGTYNGSTLVAYLNGNPETVTIAPPPNTGSLPLTIGNGNYGIQEFMGMIDEVRIWNRSLNQQEAYEVYATNFYRYNVTNWYFNTNQSLNATSALPLGTYTYSGIGSNRGAYNGTSGTYSYNVVTSSTPTVTITYPLAGNYGNYISALNYTVTDSLNSIVNCFYSLDGGITNSTSVSPGTNFTGLSSNAGTNTWTVWCNNTLNNFGRDSEAFFVDVESPQYSGLQNNESTVYQNQNLNFSATVTDNLALGGYIFAINQGSGWSNSSYISLSGTGAGISNVSKIIASSGTNVQWYFVINDSFNNVIQTSVQSFTIASLTTYGNLVVKLISPTGQNSQPMNQTFTVYANVSCSGSVNAYCGNVSGNLLFNQTNVYPDTAVTGSGSYNTPFYSIEQNPSSCGVLTVNSNPCNLSWTVNSTGAIGSIYALDANFSSNVSSIISNVTSTFNVTTISPTLSITLSDALFNVQFNSLSPGTANNAAVNNTNDAYNITCGYTGGRCNVSIKGNTNLTSGINTLGIGNVSWNYKNNAGSSSRLSTAYTIINQTLSDLASQLVYFWIDVPSSQIAGNYRSNFTIIAQPN